MISFHKPLYDIALITLLMWCIFAWNKLNWIKFNKTFQLIEWKTHHYHYSKQGAYKMQSKPKSRIPIPVCWTCQDGYRFPFMFSGVLQACHQKIIARIIGPIIHQIIPSQLRRMSADFILPSFIMASKVLLIALFPREDVIVKFRHLFLCSEIVTVRIF